MIRVTLIAALFFATASASSANERRDLLVKYKQLLTDRCAAQVAHRMSSTEAMPRCICLTEATAQNMTLSEIMELEQVLDSRVDTRHLPQVRRTLPQLQSCPKY